MSDFAAPAAGVAATGSTSAGDCLGQDAIGLTIATYVLAVCRPDREETPGTSFGRLFPLRQTGAACDVLVNAIVQRQGVRDASFVTDDPRFEHRKYRIVQF